MGLGQCGCTVELGEVGSGSRGTPTALTGYGLVSAGHSSAPSQSLHLLFRMDIGAALGFASSLSGEFPLPFSACVHRKHACEHAYSDLTVIFLISGEPAPGAGGPADPILTSLTLFASRRQRRSLLNSMKPGRRN